MRTERQGSTWKAGLALAFVGTVMMGVPTLADRGDDADRKSKNGKLEATVDGVDVVVEYGRPQVRGRQVWGGLVPYGQVWRTGADEATTISFSGAVEVEGEALPAGTYSLFTIPGEEEWVVIFNRNPEQWGAYDYDEAQDALRVEVVPRDGDAVEELTFATGESGIVLRWAGLEVPIGIAAAE